MTKKVTIAAWKNVGATFLDWSLHWLTGASRFYNEHKGWIDLIESPLGKSALTAHGHEKNFPRGNAQLLKINKLFNEVDSANLLTCYLHPMPVNLAIDQVDSCNKPLSEIFELATEHTRTDLLACQKTCYSNDMSFVVIDLNDSVYTYKIRHIGPRILSVEESYDNTDKLVDDYLTLFFDNTYSAWKKELGKINVWDLREFYAINMKFYNSNIGKYINYQKPNIYIDARELFFNGKETMINLINSLGLELDNNRLDSWLPIYLEWQEIQAKILKFSWNLPRICECIVNNLYYDISSYDLSFEQEAIIQHIMIHKYNLNFKVWQLEKFPANTQDLHALLEPNTHQIVQIDDCSWLSP